MQREEVDSPKDEDRKDWKDKMKKIRCER